MTYDKIKKEICCSYYHTSYFIAVFIASLGVGIAMFNQQIEKEAKRLFTNSKDISETRYSANQINNLPEPVQRYFKYSL